MNYRDYVVYDFETTSANPLRTQPVQIAAVVVHGRKLEIKKGSEFQMTWTC
jgi:DNA polymerase III epsilon subunit-like protein